MGFFSFLLFFLRKQKLLRLRKKSFSRLLFLNRTGFREASEDSALDEPESAPHTSLPWQHLADRTRTCTRDTREAHASQRIPDTETRAGSLGCGRWPTAVLGGTRAAVAASALMQAPLTEGGYASAGLLRWGWEEPFGANVTASFPQKGRSVEATSHVWEQARGENCSPELQL